MKRFLAILIGCSIGACLPHSKIPPSNPFTISQFDCILANSDQDAATILVACNIPQSLLVAVEDVLSIYAIESAKKMAKHPCGKR